MSDLLGKRILTRQSRPSLLGWREILDVDKNMYYYHNPQTNEVTWFHPSTKKVRYGPGGKGPSENKEQQTTEQPIQQQTIQKPIQQQPIQQQPIQQQSIQQQSIQQLKEQPVIQNTPSEQPSLNQQGVRRSLPITFSTQQQQVLSQRISLQEQNFPKIEITPPQTEEKPKSERRKSVVLKAFWEGRKSAEFKPDAQLKVKVDKLDAQEMAERKQKLMKSLVNLHKAQKSPPQPSNEKNEQKPAPKPSPEKSPSAAEKVQPPPKPKRPPPRLSIIFTLPNGLIQKSSSESQKKRKSKKDLKSLDLQVNTYDSAQKKRKERVGFEVRKQRAIAVLTQLEQEMRQYELENGL